MLEATDAVELVLHRSFIQSSMFQSDKKGKPTNSGVVDVRIVANSRVVGVIVALDAADY